MRIRKQLKLDIITILIKIRVKIFFKRKFLLLFNLYLYTLS